MGSRPAIAKPSRIPLGIKLAYSAFVAVMVPFYLTMYGPTNFLYFCDVAVLMTFVAVWTEIPLLASMPLIGIFLPQMLWVADFLGGLAGHHVTGMTKYMFEFHSGFQLFTRGLSFFHFWLPFFLLGVVYRLGYDRRAFACWTALAIALMLVCYFLMPAPPPPADNPNLPVNINYVYGMSDDARQEWMRPRLYLALLLFGYPLVFFLPMHYLALRFLPRARVSGAREASGDPVPE